MLGALDNQTNGNVLNEKGNTMSQTLDNQTKRWWTFLCIISVLNIGMWVGVVAIVDMSSKSYRMSHIVLSAVYTFVCAFRSFYPRIDLDRTVLVDHWLSSIALGRTLATAAEMCFSVQLSLVFWKFSMIMPWLQNIAVAIIPIIGVAQCFCWCGVLSGSHLWHAIEESLWAVMVALLALTGVCLWPQVDSMTRRFLTAGGLLCLATSYILIGHDVPMYIRRWRKEREVGKAYMTLIHGLSDAVSRREPTGSWEVWRPEVTWMTPYFSVGVWLSLGIARFLA